MTQINRLNTGGRIDRKKKVKFKFEGKTYTGYKGDTLSSALLANDIHLVARSFKTHRPRGILTAGSEEPNALLHVGEGAYKEPNTRSTQAEIYPGMVSTGQNAWPSINFDLGALNQLGSKVFASGFYYKTFMPSLGGWMMWEKLIRRMAGLGSPSKESDPDRYARKMVYCDVLVAGGGSAGLVSALNAGKAGRRVIIMDEQNEMGGWGLTSPNTIIDGKPASEWIASILEQLNAMDTVEVLPRTTVLGYFDYNFLTAVERVTDHLGNGNGGNLPRQRFYRIRAKQVILAQGALERPMLFSDNDRPGVMMASSVRTYINRFGVLPGNEIVVATNNDTAYLTALDAKEKGAKVTIVDIRKVVKSDIADKARQAGISIIENSGIARVNGYKRVKSVEIMTLTDDGSATIKGSKRKIKANLVAMSSGWTPTVSLYSQARGKLNWDEECTMFVPGECQQNVMNVGGCNGTMDMSLTLAEAAKAGVESAVLAGGNKTVPTKHTVVSYTEQEMRILWVIPGEKPVTRDRKKYHEFQNDVSVSDILVAGREGYESVEHLKRFTTTGMATDQGKMSNINALAIMAEHRKVTIPEVGTTTFRPPFTTVTMGAIAGGNVGELFEQDRRTMIDTWHQANNASYEPVGDWTRVRYYPKDAESMDEAVQRETKAVRDSVGLLDASTLGKIDVQGKDAAAFLNRVYTNNFLTLKTGMCRYGLMLNEHGMIWDDGVTARISDTHFHLTTTTGGAGRVYEWLEELHQTQWPEMEVFFTSVTEQWAVVSLNGPNAKKVMEKICKDINFDVAQFPFMGWRSGTIAGLPAKVYRISFTGELAYEINVPARYGLELWQAVMEAGKEFNICPYGTEAMHILRAEKGFIIVGQDTDGTVTPMDANMDWIVSRKKGDFIGLRSFSRKDTAREGRKQLIGLVTDHKNVVLPEGSHIIVGRSMVKPVKMQGHISSSYMSPNCGHSIAMAMLNDGLNRIGEKLYVGTMDGKMHGVTVTSPVFFDKEGKRING